MLTIVGLMCNSILKCIFCYPQFLIFINFCNNNLNVIFLKIYGAMIYWYFLKENLKRHNKLSWHFLKNYVLTFLKFLKINLPARKFLKVMTYCTHIYIEVSISVKNVTNCPRVISDNFRLKGYWYFVYVYVFL